MATSQASFVILLDHDNVPRGALSLVTILKTWLERIGDGEELPAVIDVLVRAYGGWFEESTSSAGRFAAAEFYQDHCPAVLRVGSHYLRITFSFADELILDSSIASNSSKAVRITHTVGLKRTKKDLTFSKAATSCEVEECQIGAIRRWSKNRRACSFSGCPHDFALVANRREQRQVDIHLSVDLLLTIVGANAATRVHPFIAVVSDDMDLLPALVASAAVSKSPQRIALIRHQSRTTYQDAVLTQQNVRIINLPDGVVVQ